MADRVFIPLPGIGTLELTREAYEAALRPIAAPQPSDTSPKLLSASEMQAATGVPASWFAAQARERRIPFRKIGRYVRFTLEEVFTHESFQRRAIPPGRLNCTGHDDRRGSVSG